jgi:hypothetical protein
MTDNALPARGRLTGLVFGTLAGQVVSTVANLGLADRLGDAERTGAELAKLTGTDPGALTRLLRAAAAVGLLAESKPDTFGLTEAGALLRTDRPDTMNAFVRMFSDPAMQAGWRTLDTSVRTGEVTFDQAFGTDFFSYLGANPELSALFNASMRQASRATAAALPSLYDFSRFGTIADIGGGDGTILAPILASQPAARGILYDTAEGLAQAEETLGAAGVLDRCELRVGDFFASAPEGADLYLIKSVLHDWDDERCATILRHCKSAMPAGGRLLILEPVLPETVDGTMSLPMYLSDLNMLVNLGGRERTRTDFEDLCGAAGCTIGSITPMPPPDAFSLIEATA